jgi:GH18 family chitinase
MKIVGFYPGWSGDCIDDLLLDQLTHINYAFAIPTIDGTLLPMDHPELIKKLIAFAHDRCIKVGLAVGGWSYQGERLEPAFIQATKSEEKRRLFVKNILEVVEEYGFDGVDMDWEYPRPESSSLQYEEFMTLLRSELSNCNQFLSASVIAFNPSVGYGQTDRVLHMVDWINIMAYDGEEESGHASISLANQSLYYWIHERKVPPHKVVLGLPFYSRPSYKTFCQIVAYDKAAAKVDQFIIDGVVENYNGIDTIVSKTRWAKEYVGGVMIWEVTQDTRILEYSLLHVISQTMKEC